MKMLPCLLLAAAAAAGDDEAPAARKRVLPLSAREAVSLSLNHNLDIEVARYQPWIEDQNILAALGTWDHVAYVSGQGGEAVRPGFSSLLDAVKNDTDSSQFSMGVRKELPFGASYDVSYSATRVLSNQPFVTINPRWNESAGVAATLPLLQGGSTTANTSTLLIARNNRDISVDLFEKALTDSVFTVMVTYWDLVFAIENKKVKEQSLEVSLRLLDDNRRKLERGVVARIDVTQAEANVAVQQEGILTAEAAVLNAMDRLKRLIDPSLLKQEVALAPVDRPRELESEISEREAVELAMSTALDRRPEVRQIRRQRANQDITIARAGNDRLPRLDLTGRAFLLGTEDSLADANRQARGGDFYELIAGFVFEWPLESSAARGALNRAELEKRRLHLQERNLENQILVEVREAVRSIKTNEKRIEATRRARILAREQLDGEMTRRDQGLSTTYRVLDVQEDLVLARTNELKSMIDYHLSLQRLQQVTGTLLERNGILFRENLQPRMALAAR